MTKQQKLVCPERRCGWHGWSYEMLLAPHPFGEPGTVTGCPKCKGVDVLVVACDEPECWLEVTCGTPTKDGYRGTCGKHRPDEMER
jgi:hypothetical protein